MPTKLSSETQAAMSAVLGLPRKTQSANGLSDGALTLFLVLLLTEKPAASAAERARGALYHDDPLARCHDELIRKLGPARNGAKGARDTVIAADNELADEKLKLITRKRVENEHGEVKGRHTPYRRVLHPENGANAEFSEAVLDFVAAVIRDPKLPANRKAQAARLAAGSGLFLVGTTDVFETAMQITWKSVKQFVEAMQAAGYADFSSIPPPPGKRGRCEHQLRLHLQSSAPEATQPEADAPAVTAPPASPASPAPTEAPYSEGDEPSDEDMFIPPELLDRVAPLSAPAAPKPAVEAVRSEAAPSVPAPKTDPALPDTLAFETPERLMARAWLPHHLAVAIALAKRQVPGLDPDAIAECLIAPVVELQQEGMDKHALQHALEAALTQEEGPLYSPDVLKRFPKFIRTVFYEHRGEGGPPDKSKHRMIRAVEQRRAKVEAAEVARIEEAELAYWIEGVEKMLSSARRAGKNSPKVVKLAPALIQKHARAGKRLGLDYRETTLRLEAAIEAGVSTWAEALKLQLPPVPAQQRRSTNIAEVAPTLFPVLKATEPGTRAGLSEQEKVRIRERLIAPGV